MGVQVAAIPAKRLFRLAQQHQTAAEGQPEHIAVPGPALPVAQQGGQFGLAILVDEQPQQPFAEAVVIRKALQGLPIALFGLGDAPALEVQPRARQPDRGIVGRSRLASGTGQ